MFKFLKFTCLLFLPFITYSQNSFYGAAGINISSISFENYERDLESSSEISPFLTLGIALPISQKVYFLGELNYSTYKSKVSTIYVEPENIKFHQINLQAGLGYQTDWLRIEGGGYIGKGIKNPVSEYSTSFSNVEDFNIGTFLGFNLSLTNTIGIFGRYYYDLSELAKFNLIDVTENAAGEYSQNIKYIQLGVSVLL